MIDKKTVEHVASLARISLKEEEKKMLAKELSAILNAFSIIKQVNTEKVKPAFQPIELKNVVREDKIEKCLSQKEALSNADQKEEKLFKGPRIV